jgi:RNA polymerase sigma-70 factor (ECF subfamily)
MPTPSHSPEQLLQHVGWVRDFARSLVADSARADDLAQETWVVALRQAPTGLRSPRAWLGAVLRSLWLRDHHREGSRHANELASARPEASAGGIDVVERASILRVLVDELTELDEPFRTALLLRYFDELTPTQIAERLGVPLPTVHSRLQRGLERMRTRLDARSGADRRVWFSSVLCLLTHAPRDVGRLAPVPEVASPTSVLLWNVIQVKTKLLVAGLVVLGAGVWMLPRLARSIGSAQGPALSEPAVPQDASIDSGSSQLNDESGAARDPLVATPEVGQESGAALGVQLVSGRVVDEEGRAIPGVLIRIDCQPEGDLRVLGRSYTRPPALVGETATGYSGAFSMEAPLDRPLRVHATANGHSSAMLTDVFGGADLVIVLGRGAALLGRITRALDGTPVEGAQLKLFRMNEPPHAATQSDADGNYRFADVPPGLTVLEVTTAWLADPAWMSIDLPADECLVRDVVLQEGIIVHGVVSDARTGTPIANAEIGAGRFFQHAVHSNANGEYELSGFGGRGDAEIRARAGGYADAQYLFPWPRMPSERTKVDFQLGLAHAAHGRVIDPAGEPVEGVYVAAVTDAGPRQEWKSTRTDATGAFLLEGLAPDLQHCLLVRADGWANLTFAFPREEANAENIDLGTLELRTPGCIAGLVVADDGEALPGVQVELRGANDDALVLFGAKRDPPVPIDLYSRTIRADSKGVFRFGDLAAGTFVVVVSRRFGQDFPQPAVSLASGERRTDLRVVIPRGGTIRGKVETPAGEPAVGVMVSAILEGQATSPGHFALGVPSTTEGAFELVGLDPGSYTLTFDPRSLPVSAVAGCAISQMHGVEPGQVVVGMLAEADTIGGQVLMGADQSARTALVEISLDGLFQGGLYSKEWKYCDAGTHFEFKVPRGSLVHLRVTPAIESELWGYETLDTEPGIDLPSVAAGSNELLLHLGGE